MVNHGLNLFDADGVYRLFADGGQNVCLEAAPNFGGMGGCPARQLVGVPFAGDVFKRIASCRLPRRFGLLLGGGGICALCQIRPRLFGGLAGFQQGNGGVFANGQQLFFSADTVFQPPRFPACGGNGQIQAAAVCQLVGLGGRLGVLYLAVV